jgi:hypothetical protein
MTEIYIGNKNKLHLRHKKRQIQQLFLINCTCITPVYIFVLVFVSNSWWYLMKPLNSLLQSLVDFR